MGKDHIIDILLKIKEGEILPEEGYGRLVGLMSGHLGFAEVDLARSGRTGYPEVVYCLNKTDRDICDIVGVLKPGNRIILLTRARESVYRLLDKSFDHVTFYERSGVITIGNIGEGSGLVSVVSAGTSDIPIAEEAAVTARVMGSAVTTHWDIGVAGIHRLFSKLDDLRKSRVIVAVAGMDGALPGVIAGLTGGPVIAVPTSVGYGTGSGGYAAMLTMLNSCAPGVAVVNIDNGFGAGFIASMINKGK
ncbi:MAG: nickel pincer cofactor biosynthesis protein LarB [Spirochaetales bacterium]|nr:nickel pincer cofactor biosynthesis protein LarB [Spirochaetales bacterium]